MRDTRDRAAGLKLNDSDERWVSNPAPTDVTAALRRVRDAGDGYVVLSEAAEEYVQTAGDVLEYRADGRHFAANKAAVTPALVERVFLAYLRGDENWRDGVAWREVTHELGSSRVGLPVLAAGVVVLGLIALAAVRAMMS